VWEVLAWATDHPAIKGAIVYEAGDYGVCARISRAEWTHAPRDTARHQSDPTVTPRSAR